MIEALPVRRTQLGPLDIWRALPTRGKRMIGPWCFLDRYGPISFTDEKPMDVAPHPHIGIQTVSWLIEGEVVHHDSLGYEAVARPGSVNVMTSGRGIAHAEETPKGNVGRLNGVQLWVALPDVHRNDVASFEHIPEVPRLDVRGGVVQVFTGASQHHSPIIGADVQIHPGETLTMPVEPSFEHGLFITGGDVSVEGQSLETNVLYDLGIGRSELAIRSARGGRALLLGGTPFGEKILMWWNFVARTPEEIAIARADWEEGRFGSVPYAGAPIEAPSLNKFAHPNPAS